MTTPLTAITRELDSNGIPYWVDVRRKHDRVYFTKDGTERFWVVPKSPSDSRAYMNALTQFRRFAGLERERHHSPRKRRKIKKNNIIKLHSMTPGKDWKQPLSKAREEARQRAVLGDLYEDLTTCLDRLDARIEAAVEAIERCAA